MGPKMYLNSTHGTLLLEDPGVIKHHLRAWPKDRLVLVHAEDETVLRTIEMIRGDPRPVHFCHISQINEMNWIRQTKEEGLPVTCEVTPHHLFLTEEGVVDTIASDHAPHTIAEKRSEKPPFGVPGVETTLPLLLTAVAQERLSLDRLVELTHTNPSRIFGIREIAQTYVEVDLQETRVISNAGIRSKCGWTPFDGKKVTGVVKEVWIRGQKVFDGENVLVNPGFGKEAIYASS